MSRHAIRERTSLSRSSARRTEEGGASRRELWRDDSWNLGQSGQVLGVPRKAPDSLMSLDSAIVQLRDIYRRGLRFAYGRREV